MDGGLVERGRRTQTEPKHKRQLAPDRVEEVARRDRAAHRVDLGRAGAAAGRGRAVAGRTAAAAAAAALLVELVGVGVVERDAAQLGALGRELTAHRARGAQRAHAQEARARPLVVVPPVARPRAVDAQQRRVVAARVQELAVRRVARRALAAVVAARAAGAAPRGRVPDRLDRAHRHLTVTLELLSEGSLT